MAVLRRGQDTTSSDINILFAIGGHPQDPVEVYYALYYVDNNGHEYLLDNIAQRIPVRYDVGKYYVPYHIPIDAEIGKYLVKWMYRPTSESAFRQECDEWYVVAETTQIVTTYNDTELVAIRDMRIVLRDNNPDKNYSCSGDARLNLKVKDEIINITIKELYDIINNMGQKEKIKNAFKNKQLFVQSSSINKKVEWKLINDVLKHDIKDEKVYYIKTEKGKEIKVTGSHSLFILSNSQIIPIMTKFLNKSLVVIENNEIIEEKIETIEETKYEKYMYDLSVEDNHNFVINNGILAHNSFAPPKSECAVAGFTERHGYLWTDEELMEFIYIGVEQVNLLPKAPKIHTLDSIYNQDKQWIPILKAAAAVWALSAMATNWAEEQFSYSLNGISLELNKFDMYMQLKANLEDRYDKFSERYIQKNNMMLGVRPSAYVLGVGRGGSGLHLGPYTTGLNPANYIRALSLTGFKYV